MKIAPEIEAEIETGGSRRIEERGALVTKNRRSLKLITHGFEDGREKAVAQAARDGHRASSIRIFSPRLVEIHGEPFPQNLSARRKGTLT